jgi:GTP cyclohydrolase FolE2
LVNCTGLVPVVGKGEFDLSTIIPEEKHRQVLGGCVDVPEESPSFSIPIAKVGISDKTVWVKLAENKGGHIPFTAKILVSLDSNKRGIHMSRMEQVISSLHDEEFINLPDYGIQLASKIMTLQNANYATLELTGLLPYIQQAPVSRLQSIDSIEVCFKISIKKNKGKLLHTSQVGVEVHHLTACPCTLLYNEMLFDRSNDPWPQATHSQRSRTLLQVAPPDEKLLPAYQELLEVLDSVLHISKDLLKRPDETELVLKAHQYPQFAEDTVREVARAAGEKFQDALPPDTQILVHSLSLESIHIHDVECFLETSLGEILATLQSIPKE